jgi:hypothetical protein
MKLTNLAAGYPRNYFYMCNELTSTIQPMRCYYDKTLLWDKHTLLSTSFWDTHTLSL